ncbi:MAG: ABC transporter permease [Terriglobales bacterium]
MSKRFAFVLTALVLAHVAVLLAGFLSPYDFAHQDREMPFAPPVRLRFIDAGGQFHLRPFVYRMAPVEGAFQQYQEVRDRAYPLRFFVRGASYSIAGGLTSSIHLFGADGPARIYLLGTDGYGRDQFSRLLWGGRISLFAGLLATLLALALGTVIGATSGFFGGGVDDVLMRVSELFMAVPWLYLLFAVRAALPLHIEPATAFVLLVAIVGAVGWARPARLVRGIVLSARERNFVLAARGFGASSFYLVRRHILPETLGVILTQAALLVPQYILAEVTLSFVGLGVGEPVPSWGNMLGTLQQYHVLVSCWWMWAPAIVLVPICIAYGALADMLQRDALTGHSVPGEVRVGFFRDWHPYENSLHSGGLGSSSAAGGLSGGASHGVPQVNR